MNIKIINGQVMAQAIWSAVGKWLESFEVLIARFSYSDYSMFPFNPSQPMPANASEVMEKCCAALDCLGQKYFLATGTALGIYREGGFINNDSDIDIDIVGEVDFHAINSAFNKIGMTLGRKVAYKGKISQLVYYSKDKVLFDMCVWTVKGGYVYNYLPELFFRARRHPIKYYKNPNQITFRNRTYMMPAPTDEWLALQYGSDWRIPKKYKRHWAKECHDLVLHIDILSISIELCRLLKKRALKYYFRLKRFYSN